jgi:hypothetical protein
MSTIIAPVSYSAITRWINNQASFNQLERVTQRAFMHSAYKAARGFSSDHQRDVFFA